MAGPIQIHIGTGQYIHSHIVSLGFERLRLNLAGEIAEKSSSIEALCIRRQIYYSAK